MRKSVYVICEQQGRRSAYASMQSDQRLCCSLPGLYRDLQLRAKARLAHTLYLQPDSLRKASYKPLLVRINLFWSIKNYIQVLNKFKSKAFKASKLSTYDFSIFR